MTGTSPSTDGMGGRSFGRYASTRRRALRSLAGLSTVSLGIALAGCSDGDGGSTTVDMSDELAFVPATISVSTGDTVIWENGGSIAHSITAYEDRIPEAATYFASGGATTEEQARSTYPDQGQVDAGETYEHTFQVAGNYEYFCIPHEGAGMKGTVEVSEE